MSSSTGIRKAILLFQHLYIDNYPFNYKLSIKWVVKHGEERTEKFIHGKKLVHQLVDLIPLLVCLYSISISASCIFLLSKIENLVLWKSSRFWGWLVFALASTLFGFIYNIIGIGERGCLLLHVFAQLADLEKEMRTGKLCVEEVCKLDYNLICI